MEPRRLAASRLLIRAASQSGSEVLGVIAVEVDLQKFERAWAGISDALIVTDSRARSFWRLSHVGVAVPRRRPWRAKAAARRNRARHPGHGRLDGFATRCLLQGEAVMRRKRVPFRGWRMASFTTYASVRERVNGVLALEIMGFAILLALTFYFLSRKTRDAGVLFSASRQSFAH